MYKYVMVYVFLFILFNNWSRPLLESHSFRQTQTALTISSYVDGDSFDLLRPPLPLFGERFSSIPLEFPTYQAIAAALAKYLGFYDETIDNTVFWGRLLSFIFFLGSAFFFHKLVSLYYCSRLSIIATIAFLMCPYGLYWGSSVMIEFCSLFFLLGSLFFVSSSVCLKEESVNFKLLPVAFLFSLLAYLTKVTTVLVFLPALLIFYIYIAYQTKANVVFFKRLFCYLLIVVIIPFIAAYIWVKWTDMVKARNPYIEYFLTSGSLRNWNFGTLEQRLDLKTWHRIVFAFWGKVIFLGIGSLFAFVGLFKLGAKNRKLLMVLMIALFTGPLVFTNLYFVHDYYSVAVYPLLIFILAVGVDSILDYKMKLRNDYKIFLIVTLFFNSIIYAGSRSFTHANFLYKSLVKHENKRIDRRLDDYEKVRTFLRDEEDPVLVFQNNWSSEHIFYLNRYAIMLFRGTNTPKALKVMKEDGIKYGVLYDHFSRINIPENYIVKRLAHAVIIRQPLEFLELEVNQKAP